MALRFAPQQLLLCLLVAALLPASYGAATGGRIPEVVNIVRKMKESMTPDQRKDPVIVSESNSRFHRMTRWWIDGMKKLGLDKFVIVALDPAEYSRLKRMGQVVAWNHKNFNYTATSFRTDQYNEIVNYKWQIVVDLLRDGMDILLTDVDIYWRQNPLPYLRTLPKCGMYLTTDLFGLPNDESSPLNPKPHRIYPPFPQEGFENRVNTGFCWLRSDPEVMKIAEKVLREPMKGFDDQFIFNTYFNKIFEANRHRSNIKHDGNTCANYGDLTFHMLRPDWFQNRLVHIHNPQYDSAYYMLHFNWLGDFNEKMDAMIGSGFMNASYRVR